MHKVQIVIKSLPYHARRGGEYRASSIHVVDSDEAAELVKGGIADVLQDPFIEPVPGGIPYLPEGSEDDEKAKAQAAADAQRQAEALALQEKADAEALALAEQEKAAAEEAARKEAEQKEHELSGREDGNSNDGE